jgi:hypothetical protein
MHAHKSQDVWVMVLANGTVLPRPMPAGVESSFVSSHRRPFVYAV